jgi:hypothetical protein
MATLAPFLTDPPSIPKTMTLDKSQSPPSLPRIEKPLGLSSFPKELSVTPESWAKAVGNLVFYRAHEKVRGPLASGTRPGHMDREMLTWEFRVVISQH